MNIIKTLAAACIIAVSSCASAQSASYTVTIPLTEDEDGLTAYLVDYDSGNKLDSTLVAEGKAVFIGKIAEPAMVQLIIDGARSGMFILEEGNIEGNVATRQFTGTPLNAKLNDYSAQAQQIVKSFQSLPNDSNREAKAKEIEAQYQALNQTTKDQNINNPLGLYLFLQDAYEMDLPQLDKAIAQNPNISASKRVAKLRASLAKKAETAVGSMYKDFSITQPDGTVMKLSDYAGKGRYTLVDFWASWCGPCMRQVPVIKSLYNKYHDKGLDVLSVAVWDEPQNTLKAIEQHDLKWPQIINAQTIPTDIYGISGIPCIMLIDPNGKIVSRDKQDQALIDDVEAAMATFAQPAE